MILLILFIIAGFLIGDTVYAAAGFEGLKFFVGCWIVLGILGYLMRPTYTIGDDCDDE